VLASRKAAANRGSDHSQRKALMLMLPPHPLSQWR
jgi:hypothetical protein